MSQARRSRLKSLAETRLRRNTDSRRDLSGERSGFPIRPRGGMTSGLCAKLRIEERLQGINLLQGPGSHLQVYEGVLTIDPLAGRMTRIVPVDPENVQH